MNLKHLKKKPTTKDTLPSKSFRIEGEIKSFPNKQKPKEFITTKLILQEMLMSSLCKKEKAIPRNKKMLEGKISSENVNI